MRKRRTREHIISDLAANHIERYALICGYSTERIIHDYGIDMIMYTYQQNGEIEDGFINIQIKASDNIKYYTNGIFISYPIEKAHLKHWLLEPYPVLLTIYDAISEKAYWVYVQRYCETAKRFSLVDIKKTYNIRVPIEQIINEEAIRQFADFKQSILKQIDGVISHA